MVLYLSCHLSSWVLMRREGGPLSFVTGDYLRRFILAKLEVNLKQKLKFWEDNIKTKVYRLPGLARSRSLSSRRKLMVPLVCDKKGEWSLVAIRKRGSTPGNLATGGIASRLQPRFTAWRCCLRTGITKLALPYDSSHFHLCPTQSLLGSCSLLPVPTFLYVLSRAVITMAANLLPLWSL